MAKPAILSKDGVNAAQVRQMGFDGTGITVAVLDTGCLDTHPAFEGRVLPGRNFTGGAANDTADTSAAGHGTAIAGIIAGAQNTPFIIAPGAQILPGKVILDGAGNQFGAVNDALSWILNNGGKPLANVVCLAVGDGENYQTVDDALNAGSSAVRDIRDKVRALRDQNVPTVVPAGNGFKCHNANAGMAFPAITPECFSVGAVFKDPSVINFTFDEDCCHAHELSSDAGEITPFSQRLLTSGDGKHFTRIFAPGSPVRSLDNQGGISDRRHGTSLAAPFVAGVVALLQQRHQQMTGNLPACDDLERWLRDGGDLSSDSSGASFTCLNALGAVQKMP